MNSLKKGEGVPLLNFESFPGVPLLNLERGPGSRGPGFTFTPCPYLGTFRPEFEKAIDIFEISNLKFLKNESLTHAVNFGVKSSFSKGPESGGCWSGLAL